MQVDVQKSFSPYNIIYTPNLENGN